MNNLAVYCPACGTWQDAKGEIKSREYVQGTFRWVCPGCGTAFDIKIEFHEVE